MGTFACGQDILMQIASIDLLPDVVSKLQTLLFVQAGEACVEGGGIVESCFTQHHETLAEPLLDIGLLCIDIDSYVEEVGDKETRLLTRATSSDLEQVKPFYNKNVGLADYSDLVGQNIVDVMRIDRCSCFGYAGLHIVQETDEIVYVVRLRKALTILQAALIQVSIRKEKCVRGHYLDPGVSGPV